MFTKFIGIIFFISILVCPAFASQEGPKPQDKGGQQDQPEPEIQENSSGSLPQNKQPQNNKGTTQSETQTSPDSNQIIISSEGAEAEKGPINWFTIWLIIINAALFAVAFIQAWFFRESYTIQTRPFIGVETLLLTRPVSEPGGDAREYGISVIWKNFGKTPPKKMRISANKKIIKGSLSPNFDFPDAGEDSPTRIVLMPGTSTVSKPLSFSVEEANELYSGKKNLFFWGWAEYDDLFRKTRRHRIEFCYGVNIEWLGIPEKERPRFWAVTDHNAADDECVKPLQT